MLEDALLRELILTYALALVLIVGLARLRGPPVVALIATGAIAGPGGIRIVRTQDFLEPGRIAQTATEHLELIDEVLAGRIDTAHRLLVTHINLSVSVVEDRVRRAIARMVAER